jgi:hypothetical protein
MLRYDELLLFAFDFNLRRYTMARQNNPNHNSRSAAPLAPTNPPPPPPSPPTLPSWDDVTATVGSVGALGAADVNPEVARARDILKTALRNRFFRRMIVEAGLSKSRHTCHLIYRISNPRLSIPMPALGLSTSCLSCHLIIHRISSPRMSIQMPAPCHFITFIHHLPMPSLPSYATL